LDPSDLCLTCRSATCVDPHSKLYKLGKVFGGLAGGEARPAPAGVAEEARTKVGRVAGWTWPLDIDMAGY
jgi:hypothetical protein